MVVVITTEAGRVLVVADAEDEDGGDCQNGIRVTVHSFLRWKKNPEVDEEILMDG